MKRPIAIYFIGVWCFIALSWQVDGMTALLNRFVFSGGLSEQVMKSYSGVLLIIIVWHVIRLINLQSFNRWFSVITLGLLGLMWLINTVRLAPHAQNPLRFSLVFAVMVSFNWLSVWYLTRRKFRGFSVQFVTEKRREKMIRKQGDTITKS